MTDIQFNQEDHLLRQQIIGRWVGLRNQHGARTDKLAMDMDLAAANGVNGNPALDLGRLMDFDDANFAHDMGGITRHMNRSTGRLEGFFIPRCAISEAA